MNTAVVNFKTDPKLKTQAKKIADDLGFSLSSLMNAYLKQLVKTKTINFSVEEQPSEYLLKSLQESEEDIKAGRVSPSFDNAKDMIAWLNDPQRKYENEG